MAEEHIGMLMHDFGAAVLAKLRKSAEKYGYDDNWRSWKNPAEIRQALLEHVDKGDPLDVAAYAAFAWWHHYSLADPDMGITIQTPNYNEQKIGIPSTTTIEEFANWARTHGLRWSISGEGVMERLIISQGKDTTLEVTTVPVGWCIRKYQGRFNVFKPGEES